MIRSQEPPEGVVDRFLRIQERLKMEHLFPYREDRLCRCGCGRPVWRPKLYWASKQCMNEAVGFFFILKGHSGTIRSWVWKRDRGVCAECGGVKKVRQDWMYSGWEADHILAVKDGGGGCSLENFQTLCVECHKEKTRRG